MRTIDLFLCLLLTCLAAAVPGCAGVHPHDRRQDARVTLVSFGSVQGELVTCGCHASPKGGLARRAVVIDSLVAKGEPFLHLELGDFAKLDDVTGDFETRFLWRTLETERLDAVCPGPRELNFWGTVRDLLSHSRVPLVSSNLTVKVDGREVPLGREYEILPVDGVRVGLISLLGSAEFAAVAPTDGTEFGIRPPLEVARELIPRLRRKADLVVLLSQMNSAETDQLLAQVPGIDVALYGQGAQYREEAERKSGTICNETGIRGQYAGELTLIVDPKNRVIDFGSRNRALGNLAPEDEEIAKRVTEAQEKVKELRAAARDRNP
jgi:5'-nucleotidase / UDP-sugar diphosphatase